jgi:hypothetical protein
LRIRKFCSYLFLSTPRAIFRPQTILRPQTVFRSKTPFPSQESLELDSSTSDLVIRNFHECEYICLDIKDLGKGKGPAEPFIAQAHNFQPRGQNVKEAGSRLNPNMNDGTETSHYEATPLPPRSIRPPSSLEEPTRYTNRNGRVVPYQSTLQLLTPPTLPLTADHLRRQQISQSTQSSDTENTSFSSEPYSLISFGKDAFSSDTSLSSVLASRVPPTSPMDTNANFSSFECSLGMMLWPKTNKFAEDVQFCDLDFALEGAASLDYFISGTDFERLRGPLLMFACPKLLCYI